MSLACKQKHTYLRDRASMFRKARDFFEQRDILEVDSPILGLSAPVDLHIEVMKVYLQEGQVGYLHTSPEYAMKRLLADGIGDIYQMSHVFRKGEVGPWHNPEFTMVEWYRCHFSFEAMMEETLDFIRLFLGDIASEKLTYRNAFKEYLGIDYAVLSSLELWNLTQKHHIGLPKEAKSWDKDTLLQLLMSLLIEPHLGKKQLLVLVHFPATQCALAKTMHLSQDEAVACRFEVYFQGMELANGYYELNDAAEQQRRFEEINTARAKIGKQELKIDNKFVEALIHLPDCCGVAVGFDRLMLLRNKEQSLESILPLPWKSL